MKPTRSEVRTAKRQAVADHKAAKQALARHTDPDTTEFVADHDRVVATEKHVPWYRR